MDLADDQFVTGPRAWQAARAGTSDPERHLTAPDLDAPELRGWPLLARHSRPAPSRRHQSTSVVPTTEPGSPCSSRGTRPRSSAS
jgi:hypothetical protein